MFSFFVTCVVLLWFLALHIILSLLLPTATVPSKNRKFQDLSDTSYIVT
ncbi:unnamed protein product [Coffea canephora]|uniref:Uncharacterized protein n=1 Tax=Coffea canephora TaxID=49390 RepID=A0A068V0T6_COFCA|nr:unnamed protein product [Coffea canephora]